MRAFFDSYRERGGPRDEPWPLLGKGPSYSQFDRLDTSGYRLLALNHVVRERWVDVAISSTPTWSTPAARRWRRTPAPAFLTTIGRYLALPLGR